MHVFFLYFNFFFPLINEIGSRNAKTNSYYEHDPGNIFPIGRCLTNLLLALLAFLDLKFSTMVNATYTI